MTKKYVTKPAFEAAQLGWPGSTDVAWNERLLYELDDKEVPVLLRVIPDQTAEHGQYNDIILGQSDVTPVNGVH